MTITSELDARIEIKAFVDRARAPNSEWYVGVTADSGRRIEAHGLQESDWYIVRQLADAEAARRVAEALLQKLECDGSSAEIRGEEEEQPAGPATSVYAYWKRGHTTP